MFFLDNIFFIKHSAMIKIDTVSRQCIWQLSNTWRKTFIVLLHWGVSSNCFTILFTNYILISRIGSTIFILKVNFLGLYKEKSPHWKKKREGPPVPHQRYQTSEQKTLSPKTQPNTPNISQSKQTLFLIVIGMGRNYGLHYYSYISDLTFFANY